MNTIKEKLQFSVYRYRYFIMFTIIGFLSILLEIIIIFILSKLFNQWQDISRRTIGFIFGLLFSFALNATINFHVTRRELLRTIVIFSFVSGISFLLNTLLILLLKSFLDQHYGILRTISSGMLFGIAYYFHRQYTFSAAKNLGIAVFMTQSFNIKKAYHSIGYHCDHIHVDLIDETYNPKSDLPDIDQLIMIRKLWPNIPVCVHIMSETPLKWLNSVIDNSDWILFSLRSRDDLMKMMWHCRIKKKKVGIVWHQTDESFDLLPFLPHVDFVMTLGIKTPGVSGQTISDPAIEMTEKLDGLRSRYGFELMFDGGVTVENIWRIPAKYIISSSAVLGAENPALAAEIMMTGGVRE